MVTTTSNNDIEIYEPIKGMFVIGYIASTLTIDGIISYGMFDTLDNAIEHAKLLNEPQVMPVYAVTANRG